MKAAVFVILVIGLTALGSAQTAAPPMAMADSISHDGTGTHWRGHVEIIVGTARVTADEADANLSTTTKDIELRGNVHLVIESSR